MLMSGRHRSFDAAELQEAWDMPSPPLHSEPAPAAAAAASSSGGEEEGSGLDEAAKVVAAAKVSCCWMRMRGREAGL